MFGWNRKKTLAEEDPRRLSLELLFQLQAGLIAKLLLVNHEITSRATVFRDAGTNLQLPKEMGLFDALLARTRNLTAALETEVGSILGPASDGKARRSS